MSALEHVAPDLVDALRATDDAARRRAARAAALLALRRTGQIDVPAIAEIWESLERGTVSLDGLAAVNRLTESLDEQAWTAQEQASGQELSERDRLTLFAPARALAALTYVLADDNAAAAGEALYEAHHAVHDLDALRKVVFEALGAS